MAFKGILFDFDGTLAQTMEDHFLAWRAALSEFGISFDASDYYPLEGMRVHEIAATLMAGKATELPSVEEVARLKESFYLKNSMFKLYPGVDELTRELARRSIPMAVVTAGRAYRIEKSTPAEFLARFQAIVSGESTTHGKPHPEPFLLGSQKLGLNPVHCIAIENAPLGVRAAKAAGNYCIGVCSTVAATHLAESDETVASFQDLIQVKSIQEMLSDA